MALLTLTDTNGQNQLFKVNDSGAINVGTIAGASVPITDGLSVLTATEADSAIDELAKYIPFTLADPGDGVAIPVTRSANVAITTGGSGETNTLAIPGFLGQRMLLMLDVDGGGDRVITVASAINAAANTIMTFADAGDFIVLEAFQLAGVLVWRIVENEGVALS